MKNTICVSIQSGPESDTATSKSLGLAMERVVEAEGGTCLPMWKNRTLTIAVQGIKPDRVQELLASFVEACRKKGRTISITQSDEVSLPQGNLPTSWSGPGAIIRNRLTRKFLFELPDGAYVVSSSYHPTGQSIFAEQVGDSWTRVAAWKRALTCGAAQRMCDVLWTEEEFRKAATRNPEMLL